jgi:molybdopterin-binding protein
MSDRVGRPLFMVRGLRAGFEGTTVLSVDELAIAEGGITVLVGENGSGKTTLLRVLNGLMEPFAGTVEFRGLPTWAGAGALEGGAPADGRALAEGRALVRARTVMVHQAPLLFRGSVLQNVGYGLRIRGLPREEIVRRAARALGRVGLQGFEARRASGLSGGEKQRVALARALALELPVLLLDEPTANVDPASRGAVERVLLDAAAAGVTVVMSTHATDSAYRLCDTLVRLDAGRNVPSAENILTGFVESVDEQFTRFRVAATGSARGTARPGPLLLCPARQGDFRVAVLPMDELLLSTGPLVSSARNQLRGRVTGIERLDGLLRVTVDCGAPLQSLITPSAASELGVAPGRELVVTFKASAVRLY